MREVGAAGDEEDSDAVERVELRGNVRATAEERDAAGGLLRSALLLAPAAHATPAAGGFEVPEAGKAYYRDLRPKVEEAAGLAGFRGAIAFEWRDALAYDPAAGRLTMTGRAIAAGEPAGAPPFALVADRLEAELTQAEPRELRRAVLTGDVVLTLPGADRQFAAARVEYDPAAGTLLALPTRGGSLLVTTAAGATVGRASVLVYNVETGQIERLDDLRVGG